MPDLAPLHSFLCTEIIHKASQCHGLPGCSKFQPWPSRSGPHRGNSLRWCPCKVCDVDQQSKSTLSATALSWCCLPVTNEGFFQHPTVPHWSRRVAALFWVLGEPIQTLPWWSVHRTGFPATAFPKKVKALPAHTPQLTQRSQVCSLSKVWPHPAVFMSCPSPVGEIRGHWDWWTEKLKVQIYVTALKEQIFAFTASKIQGSRNKRKKRMTSILRLIVFCNCYHILRVIQATYKIRENSAQLCLTFCSQ